MGRRLHLRSRRESGQTPPELNTKPNMAATLPEVIEELGCRDIWRENHPENREYMCYSAGNNTHSRLDRFLMTNDIGVRVLDVRHQER